MCRVTIETFTLMELLRDALTQMAMRGDGVSQEEISELLFRMQDLLFRYRNHAEGVSHGPQSCSQFSRFTRHDRRTPLVYGLGHCRSDPLLICSNHSYWFCCKDLGGA